MTINFEKGDFVVYESKIEKGNKEVKSAKSFTDYKQAREHMSKRWIEETYEAETICGYNPEETKYYEATADGIKDCGVIVKKKTTGEIIFELSLFICPAANFNPYEIKFNLNKKERKMFYGKI